MRNLERFVVRSRSARRRRQCGCYGPSFVCSAKGGGVPFYRGHRKIFVKSVRFPPASVVSRRGLGRAGSRLSKWGGVGRGASSELPRESVILFYESCEVV